MFANIPRDFAGLGEGMIWVLNRPWTPRETCAHAYGDRETRATVATFRLARSRRASRVRGHIYADEARGWVYAYLKIV